MKKLTVAAFVFSFAFLLTGSLSAQQKPKTAKEKAPRKSDGATISGTVVVPERYAKHIAADEIKVELFEAVKFPPVPFPANWKDLKPEEQSKWMADFQNSAEAQALAKEREAIAEKARRFNVRIEPNGNFIVYDVPPGEYGLRGRVDKEIEKVYHAFEVIGKLNVAEKADELVVGKIEVAVTPLWENGQVVPAFATKTVDGKDFDIKSLAGKNTVVFFWLLDSPPSIEFQKAILKDLEEIAPNRNMEFVSACLEKDPEKVKKFLAENPVKGTVILCGSINDPIAQTFGLRSFPSVWLIAPDQKFKMTDFDLGVAMRVSNLPLKQIIANSIDNKPIPNYPPKPPEEEPNKKSDK